MTSTNATSQPVYQLWAFGSNGSGQLGIGHTEDVSSPKECNGVLSTSGIRQLASGGNHTVALFHNGVLASTGDSTDGRGITGDGNQSSHTWQLQKLSTAATQRPIQCVAATWSATMACYRTEAPFTAGTGNSGELGLGLAMPVAQKPIQVEDFLSPGDAVTKIAAGMGHVVVVLASGEVWGWGKGRKGQIGQPAENIWKPRLINGVPFKVVDAVCGKDFTCLFGDASSGELLILGLDGSDRFGVKKNAPDSVRDWKQVAASWGSIYVLMESGELLSWGRDDHGQLSPPDLPLLTAVAAGSEHCLGLTKDGTVLAWGWGEHGNCGTHTDGTGDVKGRLNTIAMSHPATAIFAGCATSFIVTSECHDPTEMPT